MAGRGFPGNAVMRLKASAVGSKKRFIVFNYRVTLCPVNFSTSVMGLSG
jgi:hypothetical protein